MHDAVGEVLAQRKALDRGAGAGVALSLLLHGAITAAAVVAALRHPAEPVSSMIEIKFAKMPGVAASAPAPPPPVAAPQPKPTAEAAVATPAPVVKPAAKPVAKPVAASPYGQSTKKPTEQPSLPAPPQPATGNAQLATQTAVVEGDFPYTIYIERMKTLIGQHWFRPQAATGIAATVKFVIGRDGTLRDVAVESESGNGTFDRAALRAVTEASPLPPLPFGYNGTYLNVHLTFK